MTATVDEGRGAAPSQSIRRQAYVGPPLATVLAYAGSLVYSKNPQIPLEVIMAGIALAQGGVQAIIGYFTRGGRKGEPQ